MRHEWRMVCPVCAAEFRGDERRVTCSMACRFIWSRANPPRVTARDRDRWWRLFGREAATARLGVRA